MLVYLVSSVPVLSECLYCLVLPWQQLDILIIQLVPALMLPLLWLIVNFWSCLGKISFGLLQSCKMVCQCSRVSLLVCFNPLRAILFKENINIYMYLHFMSFLTNKTRSWNPSSSKTRTCLFYIINIMAADVLATQGARASTNMILIQLNQVNSVPAC